MTASDLLAELGQLGITIEAYGDRLRYAPRSAVTPDILHQLKKHKSVLLARLRKAPKIVPTLPKAMTDAPTNSAKAICQCGSTTWREVPIHRGESVRQDCDKCGRFLEFLVWYGKGTGSNGQHPK